MAVFMVSTMYDIITLSQELLALTETTGELRHAVTVLVRRVEALEQRCATLEAANAARAMGETGRAYECRP